MGFTGPAFGQGFFDALFGPFRHPAPRQAAPRAYVDTDRYAHPAASGGYRGPEVHAAPSSAPSVSYCVRLCDGRYFPLQRHSGSSPALLCKSFCPAARTKLFYGNSITHASASDGTRYSQLDHAFLYRDRVVPDCTCNGRDPFGLASIEVNEDPTLRSGDIVVTADGLTAVRGARKGRSASTEFAPIEQYSGMSADMRRQLSEVRVAPADSFDETTGALAHQPTLRAEVEP